MPPANLHQFSPHHLSGETDHPKVAGVHLEKQSGISAHGSLIVPGIGAVGGAYLSENSTTLGHNLRDAKGPADLY